MGTSRKGESGQALIEFAFVAVALMIMTVGLADAGRAFFQYNAVSASARYAARWASVEGNTCSENPSNSGASDWCNKFNTTASGFWSQSGNQPLQGRNVACPSTIDSTFTGYYLDSNGTVANQVTTYKGTPTIVGSVLQKLDSTTSSSNIVTGAITPGFDSSKIRVCIWTAEQPSDVSNGLYSRPGTRIGVNVYYPFALISNEFVTKNFDLIGSADYGVE
jgi:Flp pilus assembly protein TadG